MLEDATIAPLILVAPMRYVMDYPAANDNNWDRGAPTGSTATDAGNYWPFTVVDAGTPVITQTAIHSVGGEFGTGTHIQSGQRIAGPDSQADAHDPFGISGRYIYFEGIGFIQFGFPPYVDLPRGRIRYIRKISSTGIGPIYDVIPEEQVHTLWPENYGSTYTAAQQAKWRRFKTNPATKGYPGFQPYGLWEWTTNYSFNGGAYEWDVWYEFQMDPAYPLGDGLQHQWATGATSLYQRVHSEIHYEFNVMPEWDASTEDFQLTFTGGDTPGSPLNTLKFSEMSNYTITDCGCYGEFTWPAPFDNTVLGCTLDWQRECCALVLESQTSDEEFGPYKTAIETYLSGDTLGVNPISKWYDSSTNKYYEARSVRGLWGGDARVFPQAVNAQTGTGAYESNVILKGEWPTSVSLVRTTQ